MLAIEVLINKDSVIERQESSPIQEAWHSFIDANVDGAGSNREPLGQRKEMKIHQGPAGGVNP